MSMGEKTPREILADADRHRRLSRAAEDARVSIRLFRQPVVRRGGILGFLRGGPVDSPERMFTAAETSAIYEALRIVRDDEARRATELERQVTAAPTPEPSA